MSISNEQLREDILRGNKELRLAFQATEVKLLMKIEELNHRLSQSEKKNEELRNRVELLERKQRRNNIIIFGLARDDTHVTTEFFIQMVKDSLNIKLQKGDINDIHPLGRTNNCPVRVEVSSFPTKSSILKSASKLKGTPVRFANDLTFQQRSENRILRRHLLEARQDEHNVCFIRGGRLHLNGQVLTASDLEKLENQAGLVPDTCSDPGTPMLGRSAEKSPQKPGLTPRLRSPVGAPEPDPLDTGTGLGKQEVTRKISAPAVSTPTQGASGRSARFLTRQYKPNTRKNSAKN